MSIFKFCYSNFTLLLPWSHKLVLLLNIQLTLSSLYCVTSLIKDPLETNLIIPGDLWAHKKIHTQDKYECEDCGKKLASSGALHNHRISLHRQPKDRHKCTECLKTFSLKQKLKNHQLVEHLGQKPFACSICQKGFVHKQSLTAHLGSAHKLLNPEPCKFCSKPFYDQCYLKKHLKWHQKMQEVNKKQGQSFQTKLNFYGSIASK